MIQWQGLPSYFLSLLIIIREDGGECCNYTIPLIEKPFYISFVIIVICFQSIHLTFGCSPCFYCRGPYWNSLQPAWGCSQDVRVHIFIFLGVPEPLFTSANHHQRGGRVHYALLLRHSPQPLQPHLCLTLGVAMLDGDLNLAGFKTLNLKKLPHNLSWQWRAISSKVNWVFSSAACDVWWNVHFHHNRH